MSIFFISDLHLDENRPDITAIFRKLLTHEVRRAKALYILGDFFESWIGDDDNSEFNQLVERELSLLTRTGFPVYIMHGNRDFLIGKAFLKRTGCKLLSDEHVVTIGDKRILLMHGDTLCTQDIPYQAFRKKSRNWFFQKLFLVKSLEKRRAIAANIRNKSRSYTSTAAESIMDVTQAEVERVMNKHQVQILIHGHTHRPNVHEFQLNHLPAKRFVLAPWHEHGSVLIYHSDQSTEWLEI